MLSPWHYARIRFLTNTEPSQAPAGNWTFFWVCVKNADKHSAYRQTHYSLETLGL